MKQRHPGTAAIAITGYMFLAVSTAMAGGHEASAEQIEVGGDLYGQYCERCHNPGATGLVEYQGSTDEFRERLEGMTEEMPDFWGMFSDDEIAALYGYLQSAKQGN